MNRFRTVVAGFVFVGSFLAAGEGQAPPSSVAPSSALGATSAAASPDANLSAGPSSAESPSADRSSADPSSTDPSSGASSNGGTSMGPSPTIEPGTNVSADAGIPDIAVDAASLLPALPALAHTKVSLIGGTIYKLDRVRDEFTIQIFGGGKMKVYFDPRTHIYNDAGEASVADLRKGDRVSIDTVLDGSTVFARNIRLKSTADGATQGIVVGYREDKGELTVRDALSPVPLKLHVTDKTRVLDHDRAVSADSLLRGTLVTVKFASQKDGRGFAQEISVLASPGASFTFVGHVTALDLSSGLLVLTSATDGKTYEIYLNPFVAADNLRQSADVTVLTRFEGNRYVAQSLTVN